MSEKLVLELHNRQQAWGLITGQLFPFLKTVMQGGRAWVLTVAPRKRTDRQNKRYWGRGVLAQIAEQAKLDGRLYSAENWHEFFKRRFIGIVELPCGEIAGKSSTDLTTVEFAHFCDQVEAYAAGELGVTFVDLPEPAEGGA